ncbi:hypothetical protein E2P81_ATG05006 [Venturia nashicola]|uniref:Rhodopsin domain-containing protein n=1 Tax=Venturia nashicola TaxID=86259 RepID=A0A4Z1P1X7_9PEZI|nr:hypothetical protein E6O75_ATG05135 [Venturia nashicola]TLD34841.1 hypothetical protein E2P81_ATG05006 [Venturia nashicola]
MKDIPIAVILAWPVPDYQHPVTRGLSAPILIAVLSSFAVLAVGLKVYTRLFVQRWPGYDDWLLILAVTTTLALNTCIGYAILHYGWNRHIYDIPPSSLAASGVIAFISKLLFQMATCFLRLSLLGFYYRLVQNSGKHRFRLALHCTVILVIILFITGACVGIFICTPVQDYWAFPPNPHRKCFDEGPIGFVVSIINCLADLLVTFLPIPLVLQLKLPTRSKIGVLVGFCLGFIVSIAAAFRSYYWYQANIASYDVTWEAYFLWIASAIEVNIGMICACAPAIRVLVQKRFIPALSRLSKGTGSQFDERSDGRPTRISKLWSFMNPKNSTLGLNHLNPKSEHSQVTRTLNASARFSASQTTVKISDSIPLSPSSVSDRSTILSPTGSWPMKSPQRKTTSIQLDEYFRDQERGETWQPDSWSDSIVTSPPSSWPLEGPQNGIYPIQLDVHSQGRASSPTRQSISLASARPQAHPRSD